jgi:hypothetical protein
MSLAITAAPDEPGQRMDVHARWRKAETVPVV